jgi:ribosomal protein S18 acetylase RimI-like enzyme
MLLGVGWRVRDATREDGEAVAIVHVASWKAAYPGIVPQEVLDALDPAERAALWPHVLDACDVVLVAEVNARVAGFATALRSRDTDAPETTAELSALYVDPHKWRSGIGRQLHSHCLARLQEMDFEDATLWVLEENRSGRAFYEALGWRPDGTRDSYPLGLETRPVLRYLKALQTG